MFVGNVSINTNVLPSYYTGNLMKLKKVIKKYISSSQLMAVSLIKIVKLTNVVSNIRNDLCRTVLPISPIYQSQSSKLFH